MLDGDRKLPSFLKSSLEIYQQKDLTLQRSNKLNHLNPSSENDDHLSLASEKVD